MKKVLVVFLAIVLMSVSFSGCGAKGTAYDYILKGGTVVDGTNSTPYVADVAIKDGKIAKIAENIEGEAEKVYDVKGKIVSPGFIDIHTHSDSAAFSTESKSSKVLQGVTTELCGNCGKSPLPYTQEKYDKYLETPSAKSDNMKTGHLSIEEYAKLLNENGFYNNIAMLVGHARLRTSIMGEEDREPTADELTKMKDLLEKELKNGCYGMSLGLTYPPSSYGKTPELIELAKVVAKYDGILAVHMRDERDGVVDSVKEVIEIARQSGVKLQISHLKILSAASWGKAGELLKLVEDAKAEGIEVNCDQYPYTASSTQLKVLLPDWAHDGGKQAIIDNLSNPTQQLKDDISDRIAERGGADKVFILASKSEYNNSYLSDIMSKYGLDEADAVIKVLLETNIAANGIYYSMSEEDVYTIMPKDYICVGSDGSASNFTDDSQLHPRNFATFPQFFQIVREKNLIPIETAVYKCTGLPAKIMGLSDRGVLKEGNVADIVVFDYDNIKSNSTFTESRKMSDGILYIFVNGKIVAENNKIVNKNCGKTLLHGK